MTTNLNPSPLAELIRRIDNPSLAELTTHTIVFSATTERLLALATDMWWMGYRDVRQDVLNAVSVDGAKPVVSTKFMGWTVVLQILA